MTDGTDWIRGTAAGKLIPDAMQLIYGQDGALLGGMYNGKFIQPDNGPIFAPGVTAKGSTQSDEPEAGNSGWDWGKVGAGFGKAFTDPVGAVGELTTNAIVSSPWVTSAALLAIAAIILFISLQSLLKSGEA